jgi:broad specificity polyphosphatase/5'/3'-nucleotidase SurE
MSPTVAAISDAVIEPMPGIAASRRAVSSHRACAMISASNVKMLSARSSQWSSNLHADSLVAQPSAIALK